MLQILTGDCREVLNGLPDGSVQCCVTSPPYYGLRNYGHKEQIGLEKTPQAYVETMRQVFNEVRRVLRDDGVLFLNLGDSYSGSGKGGNPVNGKQVTNAGSQTLGVLYGKTGETAQLARASNVTANVPGLKPKNLIGIPWRVAFALQEDGWYLRSDIIWAKPNPMPESVTDRPTRGHEYIFLFSKSPTYYYDADAIKERATSTDESERDRDSTKLNNTPGRTRMAGLCTNGYETRNKRDVWTVPTSPWNGAHFATFPPDLIRPCILAGCPAGGTVLDPFGGSGTVGQVALETARKAILIELNPDYVTMARKRCDVTPAML